MGPYAGPGESGSGAGSSCRIPCILDVLCRISCILRDSTPPPPRRGLMILYIVYISYIMPLHIVVIPYIVVI